MPTNDPDLDALTARWRQARDAKLDADEAFAKLDAQLCALLLNSKRKTAVARVEETEFKVRVVTSDSLHVNEAGLKKAIGARLFNTMLKKSLDTTLLRKAMTEGRVDPVVVAQHSVVTPRKSYIKLTKIEDSE